MNSLTTTCFSFVERSFQNGNLNRKNVFFKVFFFKNFSHNSFYFWSSHVSHYCSLCYIPWHSHQIVYTSIFGKKNSKNFTQFSTEFPKFLLGSISFPLTAFDIGTRKCFWRFNPLLSKMLYRNICNIPSNSKPSVSCRNKFIHKPVFDISNFVTSYQALGRRNLPLFSLFYKLSTFWLLRRVPLTIYSKISAQYICQMLR